MRLASMYLYGEGVNANSLTATYWYRKAAEQGNSSIQRQCAEVLVDENAEEAVRWYRKAAEQDDAEE